MPRVTAFMFPGQGSQYSGMGKDIFDSHKIAREIFDEADSIVRNPVSSICFEYSQEALNQTNNAQVAMFTTNYIIGTLLKEDGIQPDFLLGHSLGEYNALVFGEVLPFKDGLKLVEYRADLMYEQSRFQPGTMMAVLGIDDQKLAEVMKTVRKTDATIANYNCPGQVVVSGRKDVLDRLKEDFKEAGAKKIVELKVSGAFHSPLMKEAAQKLDIYLDELTFKDSILPIASNVTARFTKREKDLKVALKKQMTESVRWTESVQRALLEGVNTFVESGPGKVLGSLARRTSSDISQVVEILNVEDLASLENVVRAL